MTPLQTLRRHADTRPEQVAFIGRGEEWSYRRLAETASRVALALRARGIQPGDRVALHMTNVPELLVAYYACFALGAIASPLRTKFKQTEFERLLRRLRPALYIGQAELYSAIREIAPDVLAADARILVGGSAEKQQAQSWESLIDGTSDRDLPAAPDAASLAVLLNSSGTTGEPKFIAHTGATLSKTAEWLPHKSLDGDKALLLAVPVIHAFGLFVMAAYIRRAVPLILIETPDPNEILDAIERHHCGWVFGLPSMYAEMTRCQQERARDLSSLGVCLSAGDVCPPEVEKDFANTMGTSLHSFWASTEVAGVFTFGIQPGPVSRAVPGREVEIRIAAESGVSVPRGEAGELLVRSPSLAVGYWQRPGQIDSLLKNGWFHTGDVMRQGDGDDFWYVARKKELVVRAGAKVSPVEVEQVLTAHPSVRDAAVFGIPDDVLGQRVMALVQLSDEQTAGIIGDVRASALAKLADYKVPERLLTVATIPRNVFGKIDRTALLAAFAHALQTHRDA